MPVLQPAEIISPSVVACFLVNLLSIQGSAVNKLVPSSADIWRKKFKLCNQFSNLPPNNCRPPPYKVARQQCTVNGRANQSSKRFSRGGIISLFHTSDGPNIPLIANDIPIRVSSSDTSSVRIEMSGT